MPLHSHLVHLSDHLLRHEGVQNHSQRYLPSVPFPAAEQRDHNTYAVRHAGRASRAWVWRCGWWRTETFAAIACLEGGGEVARGGKGAGSLSGGGGGGGAGGARNGVRTRVPALRASSQVCAKTAAFGPGGRRALAVGQKKEEVVRHGNR